MRRDTTHDVAEGLALLKRRSPMDPVELKVSSDVLIAEAPAPKPLQLGQEQVVTRDAYCGRQFWQTASGTARYFTAEDGSELVVPDLVSVSALETDENNDRTYERTWTTGDYDLEPYNAAEFDEPYTYIHITPDGEYSFPTGRKAVKITGVWGWPAVPRAIRAACSLECKRALKHAESPSGIAASEALGMWVVEPSWHPKSLAFMRPYRRMFLVAAS